MGFIGTVSAVAMACAPPLAYGDQMVSIIRKRDSRGFSIDICGVLIVANVTRVFYWLGERFQEALLIQSLLMIVAQFALLYVCLLFKPVDTHKHVPLHGQSRQRYKSSATRAPHHDVEAGDHDDDDENDDGADDEPPSAATTSGLRSSGKKGRWSWLEERPGQLWRWNHFGAFVEFVAILIVLHVLAFFLLHRFETYVTILGFVALGLEATLPIPQLIVNLERKSTAGFRSTVLAAWVFGDGFKTVYYFLTPNNSIAFKACAVFQLSVDLAILAQTYMYRHNTKRELAESHRQRQQSRSDRAASRDQVDDHAYDGDRNRRYDDGDDDDDDDGAGVAGPASFVKAAVDGHATGSVRRQ